MKRFWIPIILITMVIGLGTSAAAQTNTFEQYNPNIEKSQAGQIIWQLKGLGKPSADLLWLPNNNLLVTVSKNLVSINEAGKVQWQTAINAAGTSGQPIAQFDGTIFIPGTSSLAQTRINGAPGWKFIIYPKTKGDKDPTVVQDSSDNILYLPLPDALYAFSPAGLSFWRLAPWDTAERYTTRLTTSRQFLSTAAHNGTFFTVMGENKGIYKLIAIHNQGKQLWSYGLGDILSAQVATDISGNCYVTVSSKRPKSPQKSSTSKSSTSSSAQKITVSGKIICFSPQSSTPLWSYSVAASDNLMTPVIHNNIVYVSAPNRIWALDAGKGTLLWDNTFLNLITTPTISDQGFIYAGTTDNHIIAVNPQGRLAWSRKLDAPLEHPVILGPDNYIYLITQKGSLYKMKDYYQANTN